MPESSHWWARPSATSATYPPRALRALEEADFIAAEDTRVTLRLLNHFGIKKPLISYFEHNKYQSGDRILERIVSGESCALVTDAGMPAVSDPGEELVALCARAGVEVTAVPGPSAVVTAVALSRPARRTLHLEGFLSTSGRSRQAHLDSLRDERRAMVFYEAPHKLARTLADLRLRPRRRAARLHLPRAHQAARGGHPHHSGRGGERFSAEPPRGEFVLVVAGAPEGSSPRLGEDEALELVRRYRESGLSLKDAAKKAAAESGWSRNELYSRALK